MANALMEKIETAYAASALPEVRDKETITAMLV
jgi:hypothetical protein